MRPPIAILYIELTFGAIPGRSFSLLEASIVRKSARYPDACGHPCYGKDCLEYGKSHACAFVRAQNSDVRKVKRKRKKMKTMKMKY